MHRTAAPANDEVFSAIYCAGAHPLQALSYYMLPNNHVLFNALNSLLAGLAEDKVLTGRVISGAAYCAVLLVALRWFRGMIGSGWLAFFAVLTLALQFPLWGFAAQGRGYALNALAHWLAFVALQAHAKTGEHKYLQTYTWSSVLGYATVPTFFYFHAAMAMWAGVLQMQRRSFDADFWKSQILGAVGAALFYVPLLCFSGPASILSNEYVKPGSELPLSQWLGDALNVLASYDDYAFSGTGHAVVGIGTFLFAAPLALLASRRGALRRTGWAVVVMWLTLAVIMVAMRRYPFHRNLIGVFSISCAASLVAVFSVLRALFSRLRARRSIGILFVLFCALLCVRFVRGGLRDANTKLYFYEADGYWRDVKGAVDVLPAATTVKFSDEAFMARYIWEQRGYPVVTQCATDAVPFCVRQSDEAPDSTQSAMNYERIAQAAGHDFYKLKASK